MFKSHKPDLEVMVTFDLPSNSFPLQVKNHLFIPDIVDKIPFFYIYAH